MTQPPSSIQSASPSASRADSSPSSAPKDDTPSRTRAFVCLLLNVIVFPGLGTLASGEQSRKKVGVYQLSLGIVLLPLLMFLTVGGALSLGFDIETAKAWLSNLMLLLVVWNIVTGVQIFRDSWRKAKEQSASHNPSS